MERNDWHCMERNGWHSLERYSQQAQENAKSLGIESIEFLAMPVESYHFPELQYNAEAPPKSGKLH